ncbi:DNA repair-scaffolding protein-like [Haliotis rubra]|uniref:DNA repair-scaffolding protein-like n=1 Tax=Haliotis rubra TaxID=36100 RepID=UPI001EE5813B|nr:DNA repair-scaffolding protein-like [Haliotis rubra]XP_046577452.1 DNA repair-scaffolding protein-like [Haliotis rubra]
MEGFSTGFAKTDTGHQRTKKLCTQRSPKVQGFLESSFDHVTELASDASGQDTKDAELISWSSSDSEDLETNVKSHVQVKSSKNSKNCTPGMTKQDTPSTKKKAFPKSAKLELRRICPDFDVHGLYESTGGIDTISSSSEQEEEGMKDRAEEDKKPCVQLADIPRQALLNSPMIVTYQSSQASSSYSPTKNTSGLKASDWMKAMDWQTPVKASSSQEDEQLQPDPDSAKKKKKYHKGGLAEQLARVQARERSAVRMWEHRRSDLTDASKALLVRVLSFEILFSLQLAHCEVADIDEDGGEGNSPDGNDNRWKKQLILFSKQMMDKLQIDAGSMVTLYPPWQQLQLTSQKQTVLLCTHYTRVVSPVTQQTWGAKSLDLVKTDVIATWNCPCTNDANMSVANCPVTQFPYLPSSLQGADVSSTQNTGHPATQSGLLQTVTSSRLPVVPVCDSLLESIQRTGPGHGLTFRAVIQRVFVSSAARYSLLVEDSHGTMAVVEMGDNSAQDEVTLAEGHMCCFSGLKVVTRSIKERNVALFSVLEGAWSGHRASVSSQESQEEEQASSTMRHVTCPGFCYILSPSEDCPLSVTVTPQTAPSYTEPHYQTLAGARQMALDKRVSFVARVLHKRQSEDTSRPNVHENWYVTDSSLPSSYSLVTLSQDCHIPVLAGHIAVFTDTCVSNGSFHCDAYTHIMEEAPVHIENSSMRKTHSQLDSLTVSLPEITGSVRPWSLVSVQGTVGSVDEDAAYTWEECDGCGSDRLVQDRERPAASKCVSCHKQVTSPVIRMKLEVYLHSSSFKGSVIKVDLQQTTIEKLLPAEEQTDEGCDVDSVLNKEVGPLNCVVKSVTTDMDKTEFFLQEIS